MALKPTRATTAVLAIVALVVVVLGVLGYQRQQERAYNQRVAACTDALMDQGVGHDDAMWSCIERIDR